MVSEGSAWLSKNEQASIHLQNIMSKHDILLLENYQQ